MKPRMAFSRLIVVALAAALLLAAGTGCAPAGSASAPVTPRPPTVELTAAIPLSVSPLPPWVPVATATSTPATPVPSSTSTEIVPSPTPYAYYSPTVAVAEPPFILGLGEVTPEPFQVIVREGNQVWLVTDEGERELIIDTFTRMGLYLGPRGLLETDMPPVGWGSLSPDGRTLALVVGDQASVPAPNSGQFLQLSIYLLDLSTGEVELLGMGQDPVWAQDSSHLAYRVGERMLAVADRLTRGVRFLGQPESPYPLAFTWSPDGRRLAVMTLEGQEAGIMVVGLDGENTNLLSFEARLLLCGLHPPKDLTWQADGEALLYRRCPEELSAPGGYQLWRLPLDGSELEPVIAGEVSVDRFSPSPLGDWLAFFGSWSPGPGSWRAGLWLARMDGSDSRLVQEQPRGYPPSWSSDASRLAFADSTGVWTLDLVDGLVRQIYRSQAQTGRPPDFSIVAEWQEPWHSPVLEVGVGESLSSPAGADGALMALRSPEPARESTDAFLYPSPDGRYVLRATRYHPDGSQWEVGAYVLEDTLVGEEVVVVGPRGYAEFMGWSPEGSLLFLVSSSRAEGGQGRLAAVDPREGVRRELTSGEERVTGAAWSPDGETIAYALCRPEGDGCLRPELRLVDAKGTNDRAVPIGPYPAEEGGYPPNRIYEIGDLGWSPDGEYVIFRCRHGFRVAEDVWAVRPDGTGLRPLAQGERPLVVPGW